MLEVLQKDCEYLELSSILGFGDRIERCKDCNPIQYFLIVL